MEEKELVAIISVERIFFPKRRTHIKSNEFGIFVANIEEGISNCETLGKQIKLKGVGCERSIGSEKYKCTFKLADTNEKYGDTYEIIYINRLIDLKDTVKQHNFLMSILNENVVNRLFETYDNVIELLENEDVKSLVKVKGIGVQSAMKLIQKYKDCKDYSSIYTELGHLGLSSNLIKRLVDFYKSPDVVIETVNTNPYDLVRVDGIGFKKADEIAEKVGISGSNPNRVKGCLLYILSIGGESGKSYLHYSDLLKQLNDTIGYVEQDIINSVAKSLIDKKEVYISSNGEFVGLYKYRKLEEDIANELIRLLKAEPKVIINKQMFNKIIESTETEQGFNFTEEQKKAIEIFVNNNIIALTGGAGCVDCDTEFFNGYEWKKISEYKNGDKVLQYNKDGTSELVTPNKYIKVPSEYLWEFKTKYGLNQCLCEEHRVVYETSKGNLYVNSFENVKKLHENSVHGFSGKFYTTFGYNGTGIDLSEFEIRLMCAVICDGTFKHNYNNKNICRINIKKQRKKDRLEWILNKLKIKYRKEQYNPNDLDYNSYIFESPRREKEFTSYWYNCNNEQFKIICDEVLNWDGAQLNNRKTFSTTSKQTADFIQFAYATQGLRCSILKCDRVGQHYKDKPQYIRKSIEYTLCITNKNKISMGGFHKDNPNKTKINKYKTKDGYKYCFQVPSAMLVLRRGDCIFITGNCGKTVTMRGMSNLVKQYSCVGCSLSGKASVRIKEGTGMESMTIHRLLGYSFGGFSFDENNNLPYDVYFMDEATMTSGELFLSFLKAIPSGSKVVFTGDIQQLTPIGSCQVFGDILNSKVIPSARLTKPHRQALKSGIIPLSMNVINQERFCDSTFEGKQILGELQDMELDVFKDDLTPSKRVVKHYLEQYKIENNLMEVQVVVPMKNRGNMCTYNLNIEIQKEINPINPNRKQLIVNLDKERFYTIQVGDKVINTKNNYKAKTEDGDDIAVFNGNMGIVKDISDGYITINFDGIGNVVLDSVGSKALELGYACTVHKCLPKNTWIYTENGLKQLKHFDNGARVGEFKSLNDDVIKVYNGNYLEKPSHFYNNGMADCKELITKRGYKLTGTLEHGIDVLIETGEIVRKNIKDIKENDYVIINKNINVYGNNIDLNLKEPVEYYNAKKYKLPTIITEDFSEFLGLMYGDGVITSCGIALGKEHKEVVDRFCELVNIIFGYKGTVKKLSHTNMYKCEICSTYIRDICKQIKELTPNNKTIPTIILSSHKENQCAFLRGVFEDGYVRLKNGRFDYIELSQKEYKNIEIIRLMLLNLGIISTTKTYKSNKGYINTRLYIYRKHAKIFKNNIGFITKEKNNRLALCEINYNHTCSNLKYPYITNIINNMINKYNIVFNDNKFKCNIKYSINTNSITDDLLEKFLNYISNTLSNTKEYIYLNDLYNNCFIDCIAKIKNTKEYTYCLTMPETHKFVQNGIQGWNCQGSQFNRLIFAINSSDYVLLNAELGYTGITRASKYCIFVFKQQALNTMLNKREIKNKQTYLTIILQEKLLKK